MIRRLGPALAAAIPAFCVIVGTCDSARAGWPRRERPRTVVVQPAPIPTPTTFVAPAGYVPTAYAQTARPPGMLGTFYPAPMLMVRGNGPVGGGYSPLGEYGPNTLSLDGPLSPFRSVNAPVVSYGRGYDGSVVPIVGTSFSTPNLPRLSPVVYPTRANNYFGFRRTGTPPQWESGINWIDQN